jgi:hypothetical protein
MRKYIAIISLLLFGVIFHSCTKELDGVYQRGALGSDQFYANATDDQALSLINSIYTSAWGVTTDYSSGMTNDRLSTGQSVYAGTSTNTASMTGGFATYYQINYKANMIIEKMASDSPEKKRVIGEAYFWRAWAFMNLIRGWGTPPLVDHVLSADELYPSNSAPSELWNYVFTSLEEAIDRLPSKPDKGQQEAVGPRITKEAAYAVLGKSYLLSGDMANARTYLKKVIDSGSYELIDNFSDLYTIKADFSDEYIWEFNAEDADVANRGRQARITYSSQWRAENITQPGSVHLSGFNQGYSTTFPSEDFYNFLVDRGELGKNRQMGTVWSIEEAAQMFVTLSGAEYEGTPNYEGDNLAIYTDLGYTPLQAGYRLLWNNYDLPTVNTCNGYLPCKMYIWYSDMYPADSDKDLYSKANYPGMRYSEVLLLYAEACLGSASESEGLAALNDVRVRAGLGALGGYTLQDVKDEKRAELWGENERFFDVVRWGDAATEFADVGRYTYTTHGVEDDYSFTVTKESFTGWTGWDDKFKLIPFPYDEMKLNPNLIQNPGWD